MAEVQEQNQPLAVSEQQHDPPPSDAVPSNLPNSELNLSTPHVPVTTNLSLEHPELDHQLQSVVDPTAQQPFPAVGETGPEDWSTSQYIPTDSDLTAALGQTPVDEPLPFEHSVIKEELGCPSPSSALPNEDVAELLGVLEQATTEHDPAVQNSFSPSGLGGKEPPASATAPQTSTSESVGSTNTLDHSDILPSATSTTEGPDATPRADPVNDLEQLNGVTSSVSSPAEMASYHQSSGALRQTGDYSTSTSYGTSITQHPQYGYQNSVHQVTPNGYPPAMNVSRNNGMSLPSMRTFESGSLHAQSPQHHPSRQPSVPMPLPNGTQTSASMGYSQQPPALGSNGPYGLHHDRYSLQGDAHSMFAANRHKKEIKRRTKTGCLTCRKRRIKCDETHPTCKNCQKSKRECLGYDPIFKQQQQHTPTNIQPAPNLPIGSSSSTPTHSHSHSLSTTATPASTSSAPYLHYGSNSPAINHTVATPAGGFGATTSHSGTTGSAFDNILPFPTRKMKVDELVNIEGHGLPVLDGPLTPDELNECRDLYDQVYAPGLESFFEAKWYIMQPGYDTLAADQAVNEVMMGFLNTVRNLDPHDAAGMQYSASLEFRVVWDLARLVNRVESKAHTGPGLPAIDDANEVKNRVAIVDALISGEFLDHNPLRMPPTEGDYHRIREFRFWHYLGDFLRIKKPETPNTTAQKANAMSMLRELLDGRENRDVLYSLAVIRDLAPQFPPDFENNLPPHLDETDPKSKLAVARKFIQDESQVAGGTTNVVRRIAELGVRAFILPGGNIPR